MMSNLKPVKCGLIGCGAIAVRSYMPSILRQFGMVDVVKFADTVPERAQLFAEKFGGVACTNEEIYNDPEIEIVINLTYPNSHYEVSKAAILAGKNVHTEKMMAVTWEEGQELVRLAEEKGVWFTTAPDTFLGGAWQTARKLLDDGMIGEPVSAYCFVPRGSMSLGGIRGESTRREYPPQEGAAPDFFAMMSKLLPGVNPRSPIGSGLPFDMGGYYIHNLINLFGNIDRVAGFSGKMKHPIVSYDPLNTHYKENYPELDRDNLAGVLEFSNGVMANINFAAGVGQNPTETFIVYGTEGTMILPDPNYFGGSVRIQSDAGASRTFGTATKIWEVPLTHGFIEEARGIGVCDLAFAIRNGRKPRCHYGIGWQAFEVVHGIMDSCDNNVIHKMVSHVERPKAVKAGFRNGMAQASFLDD